MPKKMKVKRALSLRNGIVFFSNKNLDFISVALIDENENINTEWTDKKIFEKNYFYNYDDKSNYFNYLNLIISLLCFLIPLSIEILLIKEFNLPRICNSIILCITLKNFFMLYFEERKYDSFKFHSAEHMVINAYHDLQRIPTLDEIRKYSRFNNRCGGNYYTHICIFAILNYVHSFLPNHTHCIIVTIISIVIVYILNQLGFLNFIQLFTTKPPTDRELKLAIEGLRFWEECELQNMEEIYEKTDEKNTHLK